jgi:hypothetical protein
LEQQNVEELRAAHSMLMQIEVQDSSASFEASAFCSAMISAADDFISRLLLLPETGVLGTSRMRWAINREDEITLTLPDGLGKIPRPIQGWEELRQLQESGHLPDGSVATTTVTDDTLPGGPRTVERQYTAPFALANRLSRDLSEKSLSDLTADVLLEIADAINGALQKILKTSITTRNFLLTNYIENLQI